MITVLRLALLYAVAPLLGLVLLVAAFQIGILASLDILFYRGLVIIALATLATFLLLASALHRLGWSGLTTRDAFAASVLSLSFNVSFLVVVPVTVDRSISIYLLNQMAGRSSEPITPEQAAATFKTVYVDRYKQIDRRFHEQAVSGNLRRVGDGYAITPRGLFVVEMARLTAKLFDSHAGLVDSSADGAAVSQASGDALGPK